MQCLPGIEILLPGIKYVKFYFCHEKLQSTEDRAKPVSMQAMIVAKYWRNCLNYFGAVCGNIANGSNLSQIKESQLPWLRWCSQGCRAISTHVLKTLWTRLDCSCKLHILAVSQKYAWGSPPNAKGNCVLCLWGRGEWYRQEKINHWYCFSFWCC